MSVKTVKNVAETPKNARGKPFQRGNSGRPRGAKNKRTALLEAIEARDLEAIRAKVIEKAKDGDMTAARLVYDRIEPAAKTRRVTIDLPPATTASGVTAAMGAVIAEMSQGAIDPAEAQQIATVLEGQRRAIETVELEKRIAALEGKAE